MLLYIHSQGLGAVWLGEILKNREKLLRILGGPDQYELMAVIALGNPAGRCWRPGRTPIVQTIFFRK